MDNQHQKISGYRDLNQAEIDLMNRVKMEETTVAALVREVTNGCEPRSEASRQSAIARTEFEGAFMRLVRAVAKPVTPWAE